MRDHEIVDNSGRVMARIEEVSTDETSWGATILLNLARAAAAGAVIMVIGVIMNPAEWYNFVVFPLALPIGYFIFYMPLGLFAHWLLRNGVVEGLGAAFASFLVIVFAIIVTIGDPIIWLITKLRPGALFVDRFPFLSFKILIRVTKPEPAPTVAVPSAMDVAGGMVNRLD